MGRLHEWATCSGKMSQIESKENLCKIELLMMDSSVYFCRFIFNEYIKHLMNIFKHIVYTQFLLNQTQHLPLSCTSLQRPNPLSELCSSAADGDVTRLRPTVTKAGSSIMTVDRNAAEDPELLRLHLICAGPLFTLFPSASGRK